ncbi:MAG TPA: hypothetical protein VN174_02520 [Candidatus Methanoperedens sp.]|nr:hypothetical protein [Candidatus Methanoperedens sp.]
MEKKIALIQLIENSFLISDILKKTLLEKVEFMKDEDVEKIGKFLVWERDVVLADEEGFLKEIDKVIEGITE